MMEEDESPDSTVMIDDEEDDDDLSEAVMMESLQFRGRHPHQRRSLDEPQSSRISSTASSSSNQYGGGSFPRVGQFPPLPKLILRPPAQAGHFPSVSFLSASQQQQQSGVSRLSSASSAPSTSAAAAGSSSSARHSQFPSSSNSSGTRVSLSAAPAGLPRLEQISRSELTISRVGNFSNNLKPHMSGGSVSSTSASSRSEFARVGGVSISRVDPQPSSFSFSSRVASSSTAPLTKRIAIPALQRIGQSRPAAAATTQPQQEMSVSASPLTSRKFGRRFLKSSPASTTPMASSSSKPQMQRMPMGMMRAASTEEYYSPMGVSGSRLSTEDAHPHLSAALEHNDSAVPAMEFQRFLPSTSRKSTSLLQSQQGTGIKLHISKRKAVTPVEVIEIDDTDAERRHGDSIMYPQESHSPPSMGGINREEVSMMPLKLKERIKIPRDLIIDEAEVNEEEEEEVNRPTYEEPEEAPQSSPFIQRLMRESQEEMAKAVPDLLEGTRRTRRKREPVTTPVEIPTKMRRRRGGATPSSTATAASMSQAAILVTSAGDANGTSPRGGTVRGRGTGRGRGRPRGSTNKAKLERQQAEQELLLQQQREKDVGSSSLSESPAKELSQSQEVLTEETDETVKISEEEPSPVNLVSSQPSTEEKPLPLEGDPTVNSEVSSASTSTPKRVRGGRGSRGQRSPRGAKDPAIVTTPKTSRARGSPRGSPKKSARGDRKSVSPEGKKPKAEKKEAIKVPPPVQVFEEETRMSSSDVKPPVPERINALVTPVVVDEESRASNVSSTSTSTTAKAKRFTKDPIEERKPVTAETLYEYQWPPNDKNAEFFFLQEQISEYLGVKSFKRKYPDIRRRVVDMEERDYLRDGKIVSEVQCDLGLTAVFSCDVLDIMFNDFNEKYEEYRKVFQDRKDQELAKLKPQQNGTTVEASAAVRDRSAEFMRRILKSCAKWNFGNNKERQEERRCAFDLQTGTLHYPKNYLKVLEPECTKMGHFPVAVLPGQFTDDYKKYTPNELFYLPLNTVRYGPIREEFDLASNSSVSDSDSEGSGSSDDSSTSSSDDEDDSVTESEQSQVVLTDDSGNILYRGASGMCKVSTEAKCKTCDGGVGKNKDGHSEVLLHCSRCDVANHPTCLELTLDMLPFITKYLWECTECKNCIECNDPADEDKMLFCDCCDRGYHIYCVGLRKVPTGRWHCSVCAVCYSCGVTQPSPEDRMAEWHHEFRKGEKGAKYYLHSLCVACQKLYKKGHFCPTCLKVHIKLDKEALMECRKCEKWVHKGCVKRRPLKSMFGFMCDPCDANFRKRSNLPSHVN